MPALCRIFLDECAPDNVLEVTARAITYYLDVSAECTRRIISIEGAVKAICNRLVVAELDSRTSRDLAEQCIKVSNNEMPLLFYMVSRMIIFSSMKYLFLGSRINMYQRSWCGVRRGRFELCVVFHS